MEGEVHVVIRVADDGKAYATSPQAPGLAYGRHSLAELRHDLDDALSFHFDHPGPFAVAEHIESHYDVGDGELVIRVAQDARTADREAVARRIRQIASDHEEARSLVTAVNEVGEAVYVCALPSDTLSWVSVQLQPGETVNLALTIADDFLFTVPAAAGADGWAAGKAAPTMRLSEVVQRTRIVTPQHPATLVIS